MALHKLECWLSSEWLVSPFFQWLRLRAMSHDQGEVVFLVFIAWLFGGLGMGWLVLLGGWGPVVALAVWGLTFVLEWHHVVRSVQKRGYYPGLITSVLYVSFGPVYGYHLWHFAQDTARALS
jgi:hypothetical protein